MVDQEEQALKEARRLEKRVAEEAERLAKEQPPWQDYLSICKLGRFGV